MATNNLLNQPTLDYRRFVNNQVLTDRQLNEMLDYLNYQDRLSRLLLHGAGIVCGLNITLNNSRNRIHLSEGVALTTAGDLLKMKETEFRGFRRFDDSNVKYPVFLENESDSIDLWALSTDTSPSDVHPLGQFRQRSDIRIQDAVALLYFEDYLDEEKDCSAVDCDTQGQQVMQRLRVLLISPEDAIKIAEQDSIFSGFWRKGKVPAGQALSRHYVPRVLLSPNNTRTLEEFHQAFIVSFQPLSDKLEALGEITLFKEAAENSSIDPAAELSDLNPELLNIQYHYGFYKDLSSAYNELREAIAKQVGLCCPDPEAFPKHVLLGEISQVNKVLRHRFYPSPALGRPKTKRLIFLYERILRMIETFSAGIKNEIKITPSRDEHYPLGKRAVPFYYDLSNDDASGFLNKWTGNGEDVIPNYYGASYPDEAFNPLDISLDGHDFYRVEGHVGRHIIDAHRQIQAVRDNKALPFQIKPIAVGAYPEEGAIDFSKYRVYFDDLQVVLEAWNKEQQCLVRAATAFLSGFSTQEPGKHTAYEVIERMPDDQGSFLGGNIVTNVAEPVYVPMYMMSVAYHQPEAEKKKTRENQVLLSYAAAEDSVGFMLKDIVNTMDTRNDIYVNILENFQPIIVNWHSDIREVAITIPAQLLGYLKELEDLKLTDVTEFSDEALNHYLRSLHQLSNRAASANNRLQHLIAKEESEIASRIWLNDYLQLLNRIVASRCLIDKIKVLYETILNRKMELFGRLTLQRFIQDHPGAEHKAGVERGGTFILLYYSGHKPPETVRRISGVDVQDVSRLSRVSSEAYTMYTERFFPESFAANTGNLELLSSEGGLTHAVERAPVATHVPGAVRRPTTPHGTVIGDLCLPYVCCSDTPSTTFVFPEQLAYLRIPVDHLCVEPDGNINPIPLSVIPAGATVRAFIQNRELEGVIQENENGLFFDPANVQQSDYGSTIRFEVNGQQVDADLQIIQQPSAGFSVSEDIRFNRQNTEAILTIHNNSVPFDQLQFEWTIAGEVVGNERALEFTYRVQVKPGADLSVPIQLRAFNNYCEDVYRETFSFEVPEIDEPVEPEDPQRAVTVHLEEVGERRLHVTRIIREYTNLGLAEVDRLVRNAPGVIMRDVPRSMAESLAQELREVGARVIIR